MLPHYPQEPVGAAPAGDPQTEPVAQSQNTEAVQAEGLFYQQNCLAMAFVIWQKYGRTFTPAEGLQKGTIFPDLYRPYPA